jgi:hypothetical protein
MKTISTNDISSWISSLPQPLTGLMNPSTLRFSKSYRISPDAGRKIALAKMLAQYLTCDPIGVAVWIRDHGRWPSSECPEMYYAFRRQYGDHRTLQEAPLHVFSPIDKLALECVAAFVLLFFWDSLIIDSNRNLVIVTSHDEALDVYCDSQYEIEQLASHLVGYGVSEL